jgi:hypothetical protein
MHGMSETQTSHEPGPDELARAADAGHAADDHGDGHGHDDSAHEAEALGPVDVQAWGALAIGVAAGLVIVLCLFLTTTVLA